MKTLLCIGLLAATLTAADANVTGKWTGSATMTAPDGQTRDSPALLVLKQDGTTLTGTAGPNEEQSQPIQKGKVEGFKVTFELATNDAAIVFTLTLESDHLKGDAAGSAGGQTLKIKLDLTKAP